MLKGTLRLDRVWYFKEIEAVGRGDPEEVSAVQKGDHISSSKINGKEFTGGVGRIRNQLNWLNHFHLYCLVSGAFRDAEESHTMTIEEIPTTVGTPK